MYQVVCFGEILWDKLPSGNKPGGAPMNVAIHLHKHGISSKLISSIGNDENGERLTEFLLQQGLETDHIQKHSTLPTGVVDVKLDLEKQASYTIVKPVAWDEIYYQENHSELVSKAGALVFGSLACRSSISSETLLKLLDNSKLTIFDMNLRPPHFENHVLQDLINRCDILKINEDELKYLESNYHLEKGNAENQLFQLSELTRTNTICVTLGNKGALVLHDGKIYKHPGFSVTVVDTVGAGDAFLASFISGFLQNFLMDQNLARSCATGALVASKQGANPAYDLSEVLEISNFNLTN